MHDTVMSNIAVNIEADALAAVMDSGIVRVYSGGKPLTADTALSGQVMLVEFTLGNPAFGAAVDGVITAAGIAPVVIAATGAAAWFRAFASDGTTSMWDGTAGVGAEFDMDVNATHLVQGSQFAPSEFTHTVTK